MLTSKAEGSEIVLLELFGIFRAESISGRHPGDDSEFMCIDQCPSRSVGSMFLSIEEPHPRYYKRVVCPAVTELMPPIFSNNLVLANLGARPGIFVLLVEEDGLENMVLEWFLRFLELVLEVAAVEACVQSNVR